MRPLDLDDAVALAGNAAEAPQWSRQDYERILFSDAAAEFSRSALVLRLHGALRGVVVFSFLRVDGLAELENLVVQPAFRRLGLGTGLLLAAMELACRQGARWMRLEVRESNRAALSLYLRHGFRAAGRRRAYYSSPQEDALLLQAHLVECPDLQLAPQGP